MTQNTIAGRIHTSRATQQYLVTAPNGYQRVTEYNEAGAARVNAMANWSAVLLGTSSFSVVEDGDA